ncbi:MULTISPECIES: YrzI family small protein [Shouchella]|uniref:Sporulation protein n=2 Tax=Shouchella lehensis TaxID=300825 RepID=A0A060M1J6_9BACI|nr:MULTISPECIES: YrzI family small protein [Bacillaceae]AIC93939.1 hypothetical protein BleG1_1356 [Shouchella lehensis G1]RQW19791.1 YrzI family small protein [Bacillus sp. C1-1]TES47978.1 YrzI family small protein [Shouchella lehensis]
MTFSILFFSIHIKKRTYSKKELETIVYNNKAMERLDEIRTTYYMH